MLNDVIVAEISAMWQKFLPLSVVLYERRQRDSAVSTGVASLELFPVDLLQPIPNPTYTLLLPTVACDRADSAAKRFAKRFHAVSQHVSIQNRRKNTTDVS